MLARRVLFSVTVFALLNGQAQGQSSCNHDDDCYGTKVCCKTRWYSKECVKSCRYNSCSQDADCGDREGLHCCGEKCRISCVGYSCNSQSDCGEDEYCCSSTCRRSCEGSSCYDQSDCSGNTHCCDDDKCHKSCSGGSCLRHSDCNVYNEYCCDKVCQTGTCGLPSWVIAVIVLAVLVILGTIVGVVLCVYCGRQRRSPGLMISGHQFSPGSSGQAGQPLTSAGVFADSNVINYPQEPPPAYQPAKPDVFQLQSGPH